MREHACFTSGADDTGLCSDRCALAPPLLCSGDFNGDGVVDTADLGIMIGVFGMNCRGCFSGAAEAQGSPMSLMVNTGIPLYTEFGFTDPNDYREWFNSLSETERAAHLEDAVEVIQLAP